jgi:hypothetical protein
MARSAAHVATPTPDRYAKQLASHLGHRVPVSQGADGSTVLTFGAGTATLRSADGALVMVAEAADDAGLAQVEDVLARHLVRFGERQELTVTWVPAPPAG